MKRFISGFMIFCVMFTYVFSAATILVEADDSKEKAVSVISEIPHAREGLDALDVWWEKVYDMDGLIKISELPNEADVSLESGGTATLLIVWTCANEFNPKGGEYTIVGIVQSTLSVDASALKPISRIMTIATYFNNGASRFEPFRTRYIKVGKEYLIYSILPNGLVLGMDYFNGEKVEGYHLYYDWMGGIDTTLVDVVQYFTGIRTIQGPSFMTYTPVENVFCPVIITNKERLAARVNQPKQPITYGESFNDPTTTPDLSEYDLDSYYFIYSGKSWDGSEDLTDSLQTGILQIQTRY